MLLFPVFVSILIFTSSSAAQTKENFLSTKFLTITRKARVSWGYAEDAYLNFTELATKYGYPAEEHDVIAEDGYVLKVFRIPRGRSSTKYGPPVLMMHGFSDSADVWVFPGPGYALGYQLADAGYDVWCANYRGNKYSRKHISLNPDKDITFWKFSYDEMARYDLPALTDYILGVRGLTKMNYVGFSQGSTIFFAMGAYRPEYYNKYELMIALAPVSWLNHLYNPYLRELSKFMPQTETFLKTLGMQEILANSSVATQTMELLCQRADLTSEFCRDFYFLIMGHDPGQMRKELIPIIFGHFPCGASLQNLIHLGQGVKSTKFKKFDHGAENNLRVYGSLEPPEYNVSLVTTPVAIMHGRNDWLSAPKDVKKLRRRLPNVVNSYLVPRKEWQHTDHVLGKEAPRLIGDRIIRLLDAQQKDVS